jgi:glycosyltransferase involved in cell wall biosynthesis
MTNQKVTVSVIVPIRNEERYIAACLQSLINQTYPQDAYEVLVVDGRSSDRSRQIVEELGRGAPNLHCLDNPAAIAPAAMNIGIRHASGEFIVRADGHTAYPSDYLENCVKYLQETGAENVGGPCRTVPADSSFGSKMVATILTNPFGVGDSRFRTSNFEGFVDTVPFGAFRRELFDRVGMYDEKLVRNQDNELNARIRKAGGKIYQTPALTTEYHPLASVAELLKQTYKTSQWHIFSMRQNASSMGLRHFVPAAFVLVLAGLLASALWNRMSLVGLGVFLLAYFAAGFYFSFRRSQDRDVILQCALPLVCLIFHIVYGLGTIAGLRYLFVAPPSAPIRAGQAVNPGVVNPGAVNRG